MKHRVRSLAVVAASLIVTSLNVGVAHGAVSPVYYFSENGVNYSNQNLLLPDRTFALQTSYTGSGGPRPATFIGGRAIVYSLYYDRVCDDGVWTYNSTPGVVTVAGGVHRCPGTLHWARGQSRVWNASRSSYVTKPSLRTPNVRVRGIETRSAARSATRGQAIDLEREPAKFPRNENGDTYGSLALVDDFDDSPDLIGAIGDEHAFGFLRAQEFLFTDELVFALYAVDGVTRVGTYRSQRNPEDATTTVPNSRR